MLYKHRAVSYKYNGSFMGRISVTIVEANLQADL